MDSAGAGGAEHPEGRHARVAGHHLDRSERMTRREALRRERVELGDLFVDLAPVGRAAAQGRGGDRIGSGRAPDAEVDATRVEGLERAKDLEHVERRVVREHDASGAHADVARDPGDVADEHLGRRAGDAGDVVVLGDPVAGVAELVDPSRQRDGRVDGRRRRGSRRDGKEVEDRERDHGPYDERRHRPVAHQNVRECARSGTRARCPASTRPSSRGWRTARRPDRACRTRRPGSIGPRPWRRGGHNRRRAPGNSRRSRRAPTLPRLLPCRAGPTGPRPAWGTRRAECWRRSSSTSRCPEGNCTRRRRSCRSWSDPSRPTGTRAAGSRPPPRTPTRPRSAESRRPRCRRPAPRTRSRS